MSDKPQDELAFGKENYKLFALSAIVVIIGYILMVGGGSDDPNVFKYDELFSFQRITLAPIVVLIGFGIGFYGILKRPKNEE
tara:strand:- start:714 stop:959 length:246 start_codon:yes stop_codon:yes gene_type:complete